MSFMGRRGLVGLGGGWVDLAARGRRVWPRGWVWVAGRLTWLHAAGACGPAGGSGSRVG